MGTRLYPLNNTPETACQLLGLPAETVEFYRATTCPVNTCVVESELDKKGLVEWIIEKVAGLSQSQVDFVQEVIPASLEEGMTIDAFSLVNCMWSIEFLLRQDNDDVATLSNFLSEGWGKFSNGQLLPDGDEQYGGSTEDPELAQALWLTSTGCRYGMPQPDWTIAGGAGWC
jgi:hypothetical protein